MPMNIDPSKYQGPLEDLEKKETKISNKRKLGIIFGAGVFVFFTGIFIFFMIFGSGEAEGMKNHNLTMAYFMPAWIALFVPIIISSKRKGKNGEIVFPVAFVVLLLLFFAILAVLLFFLW